MLIAAILMLCAASYERYRREHAVLSMLGEQARVIDWQGQRGTVRAQGKNWEAFTADPVSFKPGEKVLIGKANNGVLKVNQIEEDEEPIDLLP